MGKKGYWKKIAPMTCFKEQNTSHHYWEAFVQNKHLFTHVSVKQITFQILPWSNCAQKTSKIKSSRIKTTECDIWIHFFEKRKGIHQVEKQNDICFIEVKRCEFAWTHFFKDEQNSWTGRSCAHNTEKELRSQRRKLKNTTYIHAYVTEVILTWQGLQKTLSGERKNPVCTDKVHQLWCLITRQG